MSMTDPHIQNWVGSRCDRRRAQSRHGASSRPGRAVGCLVVCEIYILIAASEKTSFQEIAFLLRSFLKAPVAVTVAVTVAVLGRTDI